MEASSVSAPASEERQGVISASDGSPDEPGPQGPAARGAPSPARLLSALRQLSCEAIAGVSVRGNLITVSHLAAGTDGSTRIRNAGWAECAADLPDDDLAAAIRHLWRQCRIPTRTVIGSLDSDAVQYRWFDFNNLAAEELRPALTLEAEELLHLPREAIALDWQEFHDEQPSGKPTRRRQGILIAAPRRDVDRQVLLYKHAGLYTVALDIPPFATANLFRNVHPTPEGTICLLNVCRRRADLAVLDGASFTFPRSFPAHAAGFDEAPDYLVENVADTVRFVRYRLRRPPVKRVYITGRGANLPGLTAHIEDALGLPVVRWNPLDELEGRWPLKVRSPQVREEKGPWLATALGLALRGALHDAVES